MDNSVNTSFTAIKPVTIRVLNLLTPTSSSETILGPSYVKVLTRVIIVT